MRHSLSHFVHSFNPIMLPTFKSDICPNQNDPNGQCLECHLFSFCIVRAISQLANRQKLPSAPYTNFGNARGTLKAFSEVPTSSDVKTMGNHQLIYWIRALYISLPSGTRHAIWASNVNHCFMLLKVDTKQRENDLRLSRALDWVWGH